MLLKSECVCVPLLTDPSDFVVIIFKKKERKEPGSEVLFEVKKNRLGRKVSVTRFVSLGFMNQLKEVGQPLNKAGLPRGVPKAGLECPGHTHNSSLCFPTSAPFRNLPEFLQTHLHPPGQKVNEPPNLLSPGPRPSPARPPSTP